MVINTYAETVLRLLVSRLTVGSLAGRACSSVTVATDKDVGLPPRLFGHPIDLTA
jgi:hypothetical protein